MLKMRINSRNGSLGAAVLACAGAAGGAHAADAPSFDVYGFAMVDYIQDFNRVDPNWAAALRPSKIPTVKGQFGDDGQSIISARQSRFGVQADQPIAGNDLYVKFEFDLFGTGVDEGQTTIRLRHFYGSWGPILAGQTNTVFMDADSLPNAIEYWGPIGMVFLRNPQVRFTHKWGRNSLAIAIEKPSNDIDPGQLREIDPALASAIQGDQKIPDFTAHYRYDGSWGHFQLAGILRRVGYDSAGTVDNKPKGSKLGWGINASSNVKIAQRDVLHLSVVYGQGIASYMNDGGVDLAPGGQPIGPSQPIAPGPPPPFPIAQKSLGLLAYYDHAWSDKWSTSLGWSMHHVDNTSLQANNAFHEGQYATANLLFTPDRHLLMGAEFQWGQRQDKDHATGSDARVQFSFKYSFTSKDFFP